MNLVKILMIALLLLILMIIKKASDSEAFETFNDDVRHGGVLVEPVCDDELVSVG